MHEPSSSLPGQHLYQLLDVFRRLLVFRFVLAQVFPDDLHLFRKRLRVFGQLRTMDDRGKIIVFIYSLKYIYILFFSLNSSLPSSHLIQISPLPLSSHERQPIYKIDIDLIAKNDETRINLLGIGYVRRTHEHVLEKTEKPICPMRSDNSRTHHN